MPKLSKILLAFFIAFASLSTYGQTVKEYKSFSLNIDELPEYVVIFSETTGRIMGNIVTQIDSKKSPDKSALDKLDDILTNKKKLRVRNQTDLLNIMLGFGYEYVNAFSAGQSDMSKIVFRKKVKYRTSE